MGLHWLHSMGKERTVTPFEAYRWIHYEDSWLQDAVDRARAMKTVRLLLFKTNNRICTPGNPIDPYDHFRVPATSLQQTLQQCESMVADRLAKAAVVEKKAAFAEVSAEQIAWYCRLGTFTLYGTSYLNERLYRFVEQQKLSLANGTMKIGIYNDHAIQTCEFAHDSRHYRDLNVPRLWVLANLIVLK